MDTAKLWVSHPKFTGQVEVSRKNLIVKVPPVWARFQGQPLGNLYKWLKNLGPGLEYRVLVEMPTVVVNLYKAPFDVKIMRPSIYGNPYKIGPHGNRERVIDLYRTYLQKHPDLIEMGRLQLKGKILGCCCKPLACHGDVWVEILDREP